MVARAAGGSASSNNQQGAHL